MADPNIDRFRVSGVFTNLDIVNPLFLKFQLNPDTIETKKDADWQSIKINGWESPINYWSAGGDYTISFELFFDATGAIPSSIPLLSSTNNLFLGVLPQIAILESFVRPRTDTNISLSIRDAVNSLTGQSETTAIYYPPPECFFLYGLRWFRGIVKPFSIREELHNPFLVPKRITIPIEYLVIEEGKLYELRTIERNVLAIFGSGVGIAEVAAEIGTGIGSVVSSIF